jgi:poly(3-hydroxybutyrate) depolymerase
MFLTLQRLTFAGLGFILWPLSLPGQQAAPVAPASPVVASVPSAAATEIKLTEGWVLPRGERPRGRASLPVDPLEWAYAQGSLAWPDRSADESPSADGLPAWKKVTADEQGRFDGRTIAGGWLLMTVEAPSEQVWLLEAQGHGSVRINGAPRVGDVYANGRVEIPVLLRQGEYTLIFTSGRGAVTARLRQPEKPVFFSPRDPTFPHIIRGEHEALWGGFLVVNATASPQSGLKLKASGPGFKPTVTDVPPLPPLSLRKVAFRLDPEVTTAAEAWAGENVSIALELFEAVPAAAGTAGPADVATVSWQVRHPSDTHVRTFRSQIEGSVQYYGVVPPAAGSAVDGQRPGLMLSLHGAGVEGAGQAGVYRPRPNAYVITPTNRRSFGFDWEDWGRWDALEVLELARERFQTEPRRTWLTGHSMGGHGTWHIGSLFPDRFAAVGPSAGWISFSTYAGRSPEQATDAVSVMLRRPMAVSDTLARSRNLQYPGVYILHGDADDNVPVEQARQMRSELAQFHPDFVYKEQPGAGHWWGNVCCDWPPMMTFFDDRQVRLPQDVVEVNFVTPSPAASSECFWAEVESQQRQGEISQVNLRQKAEPLTVSGTTQNVAVLALKTGRLRPAEAAPHTRIAIDIDGTTLPDVPVGADETVRLQRTATGWQPAPARDVAHKSPRRAGPFKNAFHDRFMLVYGTGGTTEENAWMLDRARHDAEVFWYRGNGSVDVVPDSDWKMAAGTDRSVIVYGNASINAAWRELLADSPIAIHRDGWQVRDEAAHPEPVACLMVRPRPGSPTASVAVIGGTTLAAMRSTDRLPIFSSGTAYPDVLIVAPDYLRHGPAAVKLTGYFGPDWSLARGEWARPTPADSRPVEK